MPHSYPIIRDFRNCTRDDFAEAAKELLVLIIFAGLPIWLGFVISGLSKGDKTVARFLLEFLASGEGLLISAALVGPLFYVITRKYGELPESLTIRFPQGWLFVVLITLICMTAAALFGFDRVFKDHSAHTASSVFEEGSMRVFSSMVLTFAILIVYLVSVLRNYLERGAASIMRDDTQNFFRGMGQKMRPPLPPDPDTIQKSFRAIKVAQPIGDLFIAAMDQKLIQDLTFFDVRRRIQEERDVERYLGIQRPLQEKRVKQLQEYVNYIDATFPSSIILSIDSEYAEYDEDSGVLTLSNTVKGDNKPTVAFRNLCRVIDGQHRIAGLEGFSGSKFDVIVSIFVGSDISDQAYVFATVNLEQTKVNKSLAYDLFELARTRSPIKTCHNIAVALDKSPESPFFQRIKRLGVATEGRAAETITQSTFVNALVEYISDNPKQDRDDLIRGTKLRHVKGEELQQFCFRNLFIDDEDVKIGKIVEQYFLAVQDRWPDAWRFRGMGLMLNRTNGFRALMKVFGRIYNDVAAPGDYVPKNIFLEIFKRVKAKGDSFNVQNYPPGTSGEAQLRRFLIDSIFT